MTGGKDRWDIKTGTDPAAHTVTLTVTVPSSIAALRIQPSPHSPPTARITGVETVVYGLTCTVIGGKLESDGDYHLVLSDDAHQTMIAEIPDPQAVGIESPWRSIIAQCRTAAETIFGPLRASYSPLHVPVHVTGVFFFDHPHGQVGCAPNACELHPVLSVVRQ